MTDNPRYNLFKFKLANWMWGGALRRWHRNSIAISEAVLRSTAETFGVDPERMTVIYRGIDESRARPQIDKREIRARIGLPDADPFLLAVGRLAPQKGHKYLVAALSDILPRYPKTHVAIAGEGWLGEQLMAQAKALGVQDHITLLGKRRDVPELMASCDMFVFPSLFEGLGVSLLEASFMGCACISTNTGPIPEIIADGVNGVLVPPADSRALAAAVSTLAGDPALRARLGDAASKNVKSRFMLADKVADMQRWYAKLFAQGQQEQ